MEHNDFENSQYRRRSGDLISEVSGGSPPNLNALVAVIEALRSDIKDLKMTIKGIESAFPRNDLDAPDFDGHRKDHVHRIQISKQVDGLKFSATMKILGWAGGILGLVFLTGLGEHVKRLLGT
jgi:hypothetical protein